MRRESRGRESETERVFGRAGRAHNPPELLLLLKTALLRIFGTGRNRPSFWAKRGKNWGKFGVVMLLIPNCFIPIQFIVESRTPSNQV